MRRIGVLPFALVVSLAACSGGNSSGSGFDNGGDGGSNNGDGGGNRNDGGIILPGGDAGNLLGDGATGDGCSDAAKLIYLIDDQGGLHSFYPPTVTLKDIGTVNCKGAGGSYNSMAVDRSATAWVNATNGNLYKVDTSTAACTSTTFKTGQQSFDTFGMGFASDVAGGTAETLYVNDNESQVGSGDSNGMGKIDLGTLVLTKIGDLSGSLSGHDCELTGTGDARLYGFFFDSPSYVAEIDKASAKVGTQYTINSINRNNTSSSFYWAFSFWGGDFYLYTADAQNTTRITRFRPSDNSETVIKDHIGYNVVGAGVSTCAPTQPPK